MLDTASQIRPTPDNSNRWQRDIAVAQLIDFEAAATEGISQRQFADAQHIPRTTLRDWKARKDAIDAPDALVDFFESPEGLALLHRLVVAAHLVMTLMGNCGIRLVSHFFEFAGLAPFLANSYGAQRGVNAQLHQQVRDFGVAQRKTMAKDMPHRKLAVCADETFPTAGLCLVAIEPVSGFILVETHEEKRDAETWNRVLNDGLAGLDVTIEQMTTDEATALKKLARDQGAVRGPDLFHVQHPINKGCGPALARKLRAAEAALEAAAAQTQAHRQARHDYDTGRRPPGRRPHFETRIAKAEAAEAAAQAHVEEVEAWRAVRADTVAGLAVSYHPYDVTTGAARSGAMLEAELHTHFQAVKAMATQAALSTRGQKLVEKAARLSPQMVAYIEWFHQAVDQRVKGGEWTETEQDWLMEHLIPGWYLHRVASRASTSEARAEVEAASQMRLKSLCAADSQWWQLPAARRVALEALARECADLFQRSSSCVEGRNGQLSLFDHSTRGLSPQKLEALTVIHNYVVQRPDGTTAAERFFGSAPDALFQWLLDHIPLPSRPAKRRPRPHKTTLLKAS